MAVNERVILNIRVIRSFEFRNIRCLVLKDVPLDLTGQQLKELIMDQLSKSQLPPPVRKYDYDTLKVS